VTAGATPEARLASIITALEAVGLRCLVMGGHAVRFYGFQRNTNDFDLHLAPENWDDLDQRLRQMPLFAGQPPVEGPTWRPNAFRRFQIGTLPSGREEWLEFWRENHLLPPFCELFVRREEGSLEGHTIAYLSLPDLIRSKETERESDWEDIAVLEEFLDARRLARAGADEEQLISAIANVRSRRGFETLVQRGLLADPSLIRSALAHTRLSISQAYLLPWAPATDPLPTSPIEPVVVRRLRTVHPGSNLHLALVEIVRRQYKQVAQLADKVNKETIRAGQAGR
jgi:hypothetical protein